MENQTQQTPEADADGAGLVGKVANWLRSEGYSTEFRAANIFRKHRFSVRQGEYVSADEKAQLREIDVLASLDVEAPFGLLRCSHVVECKWSADKPWVIFSSPTARMAPSACAAQSISSSLGEALIWLIAGNERLQSLSTFAPSIHSGFGGRQAFSKTNDVFYSAIQGVVSNSVSYVEEYDRYPLTKAGLPEMAVLAFPVIVVDGNILKAAYDPTSDEVQLETVPHIRCHWRGAQSWRYIASVDIVSLQHLDAFVLQRANDMRVLIDEIFPAAEEVVKFAECGDRGILTVSEGPRGTIGVPALLRQKFAGRGGQGVDTIS